VPLHQDLLRSTRLNKPRRNKIAKTILANHADGDMDFATRAVPAAETDIIAKTVIHPNIFAFTSTHFELQHVLLPMRFSPGDFHFMVDIRKARRRAGATGKNGTWFCQWGFVRRFRRVIEAAPYLGMMEIGFVFFNFLLCDTSLV
jgi:hypothetical protein